MHIDYEGLRYKQGVGLNEVGCNVVQRQILDLLSGGWVEENNLHWAAY